MNEGTRWVSPTRNQVSDPPTSAAARACRFDAAGRKSYRRILSNNVARRQMTKGALAMAVALIYPKPEDVVPSAKKVLVAEQFPMVPKARLSEARLVARARGPMMGFVRTHDRRLANDPKIRAEGAALGFPENLPARRETRLRNRYGAPARLFPYPGQAALSHKRGVPVVGNVAAEPIEPIGGSVARQVSTVVGHRIGPLMAMQTPMASPPADGKSH